MVWLELLLIVRFLVVVLVVVFVVLVPVLVLMDFGIVTTVSTAMINQIIDLKIG
jgi:hypothetical protein